MTILLQPLHWIRIWSNHPVFGWSQVYLYGQSISTFVLFMKLKYVVLLHLSSMKVDNNIENTDS